MISQAFDIFKYTRNNMHSVISKLDQETLYKVPKGFGNNIFWNATHCVVTHKLLCYKLAGRDTGLEKDFIDNFRKGSKYNPDFQIDQNYVLDLLVEQPDAIKKDYEDGIFKQYTEYETSYGVVLKSVEDAILFNNTHEGVHFGYLLSQKKALGL